VASEAGLLKLTERSAQSSRARADTATEKKKILQSKKEKVKRIKKATLLHPHFISQTHNNLGKRVRREIIFSGAAIQPQFPAAGRLDRLFLVAVQRLETLTAMKALLTMCHEITRREITPIWKTQEKRRDGK